MQCAGIGILSCWWTRWVDGKGAALGNSGEHTCASYPLQLAFSSSIEALSGSSGPTWGSFTWRLNGLLRYDEETAPNGAKQGAVQAWLASI